MCEYALSPPRISKAVNATIHWDANGCVSSMSRVRFHSGAGFSDIQSQFESFVTSPSTYNVNRGNASNISPVGCNPGCSWYDESTRTAWIFDADFDHVGADGRFRRGRMRYSGCRWNWFRTGRYDLAGLILHELFGHGAHPGVMGSHHFRHVYELENDYHRIKGQPERCPTPN
jgi:hypothetical protein